MSESSSDSTLREEFNRWAEAGRGEGMEQDHLPITLPVLERMRLAPADNVLDVGCGAGWLSRRLAKMVPEGRVVGMDISDEMIHHARRSSVDFDNLMFIRGEVAEIPWQPNFFSRVISVESSYYWPDPAAGLRDIFRVLNEGGSAWILINYYRDNPQGRIVPRGWFQECRARAHRGCVAVARSLHGPVVPRRGASSRVQGGGRAADFRCDGMRLMAARI